MNGLRTSAGIRRPLAGVAALILMAGCFSLDTRNEPPSAAQAYVIYILDQMERQSVRRAVIDWASVRRDVLDRVPAASAISDAYPAVERALLHLEDGTSSFTTGEGEVLTGALPACQAPEVGTVTVPDDVGYVRVASFDGVGPAARAYADELQAQIRAQDRDGLAGWIIDLRGNGGQTVGLDGMWSMLAGIGPLLGSGTAGHVIQASGSAAQPAWSYEGGAVRFADTTRLTVSSPHTLRSPAPRVAVIVDRGTARSGEGVAISFRGLARSRSFGSATCGLPLYKTPIQMFDGGVLHLATGYMADRGLTSYASSIQPDEIITDPGETFQRAIAWVRGN